MFFLEQIPIQWKSSWTHLATSFGNAKIRSRRGGILTWQKFPHPCMHVAYNTVHIIPGRQCWIFLLRLATARADQSPDLLAIIGLLIYQSLLPKEAMGRDFSCGGSTAGWKQQITNACCLIWYLYLLFVEPVIWFDNCFRFLVSGWKGFTQSFDLITVSVSWFLVGRACLADLPWITNACCLFNSFCWPQLCFTLPTAYSSVR